MRIYSWCEGVVPSDRAALHQAQQKDEKYDSVQICNNNLTIPRGGRGGGLLTVQSLKSSAPKTSFSDLG